LAASFPHVDFWRKNMKKMLFGLLMLVLATGAFAQEVTVSGSTRLDVGLYESPLDAPEWYWSFLNDGTMIQADVKAGKVEAFVRFRTDGVYVGNATVDLDPLKLSIGHNRLPGAFWSSYNLYEDGHYGIGPSSTNRSTYLQAKVAGFFIGLADSTNSWENPFYDPNDSTKGPKDVSISYLNGKAFTEAFSPIIYLGYDYEADAFAAGFSFVGVILSKDLAHANDMVFSFMVNPHFRLLSLDPIGLGLNVALYGAPIYGPFSLTKTIGGGTDELVLEALLDLSVGIENVCDIGFGAGLVMNFKSGGLGTKIGLSATFDIGNTGFCILPGVAYTLFTDAAGGGSTLDAGLSFIYSF
jgi:hypothetical protein